MVAKPAGLDWEMGARLQGSAEMPYKDEAD